MLVRPSLRKPDAMNDEPQDLSDLCERVRAGWSPKFVFFWGHEGSDPRSVGRECLSQWYPAPFVVNGVVYPTAEHFMMAAKARLFGGEDAAHSILEAAHPAAAKKAGRQVRGFVESVWVEHRVGVIIAANEAKFSQSPALRAFLLATGKRVLAEASPTDRIWGIGLAAGDPQARNPLEWTGLNLLGFALMVTRARLAEAAGPEPNVGRKE